MTRAEQRALEAYPVNMTPLNYQDLIEQFGGKTEVDVNTYPRCLFQEGYEQAEEDLGWISVKDRIRYIEKIRHEIEFLKELNEGLYTEGDNSYYEGHDNACDHILAFIDSLPEDASCVYDTDKLTPTPSVNIEDVARVQFASHAHVFDRKRKAVFDWEQFKEVAGIFYGFGKRDSLPEEKPSEDLEEAAEKYADEETMYKPIIDKRISQRADEFAQREYICDSSERDALSKGYYWGYKDAQKDLALTWQDMAKIDAVILDVNNEFAVDYSKEIDRQKFYKEVLKRFKEINK